MPSWQLLILHGDFFHLVALADGVDDFLRVLDHFAEDRVLVVEPGRGDVRDEELRAVRVGAGVGHREDAGAAVLEVFVELVFERVAGAAGAGAFGAAGLDHEVGDDAVEREAVVEAVFGELLEVGDGFRCFVVVELEADVAVLGFDRGGFHLCRCK